MSAHVDVVCDVMSLLVTSMTSCLQPIIHLVTSLNSFIVSFFASLISSIHLICGLLLFHLPSLIPIMVCFSNVSSSTRMMCPKNDSFCFAISACSGELDLYFEGRHYILKEDIIFSRKILSWRLTSAWSRKSIKTPLQLSAFLHTRKRRIKGMLLRAACGIRSNLLQHRISKLSARFLSFCMMVNECFLSFCMMVNECFLSFCMMVNECFLSFCMMVNECFLSFCMMVNECFLSLCMMVNEWSTNGQRMVNECDVLH